MLDKKTLITKGLNRDEILERASKARQEITKFTGDKSSEEYNNYIDKLKKIEEKLEANNKIKEIIKGNSTEMPDIKKFNLHKYADQELLELASQNFKLQSDNYYVYFFSCLGCGILTNNKLIDPRAFQDRDRIEEYCKNSSQRKIKTRKTTKSEVASGEKFDIDKNTKIQFYHDADQNTLCFNLFYQAKDYTPLDLMHPNTLNFSLIIDPVNKKLNIIVDQIFINDPKLYPEEYQILMLEKLINYLTQIGMGDDKKTDFQKEYPKFQEGHPEISDKIDILKMISEFDVTITQKHIANPKTLILASHDAKSKALGDETSFVGLSPNISNSTNFILKINEVLKQKNYNQITMDNKIKAKVDLEQTAFEIKALGQPFQCCIPAFFRINDDMVPALVLSLEVAKTKSDRQIPLQISMSTNTNSGVSSAGASQLSYQPRADLVSVKP